MTHENNGAVQNFAGAIVATLMPTIELFELLIEKGIVSRDEAIARIERLISTASQYGPNEPIVRETWESVARRLRHPSQGETLPRR